MIDRRCLDCSKQLDDVTVIPFIELTSVTRDGQLQSSCRYYNDVTKYFARTALFTQPFKLQETLSFGINYVPLKVMHN